MSVSNFGPDLFHATFKWEEGKDQITHQDTTQLKGSFHVDGRDYEVSLILNDHNIPENIKKGFENNILRLIKKTDIKAIESLLGHSIQIHSPLKDKSVEAVKVFNIDKTIQHLTDDESTLVQSINAAVFENISNLAGTVPFNPTEATLKIAKKGVVLTNANFSNPAKRKEAMDTVFDIYEEGYCPQINRKNLETYIQSDDYMRHCSTARVYYNNKQMGPDDAHVVMYHREPSNIAMSQLYDKDKLEQSFGHSESAYNDITLQKSDGRFFWEAPNTASVYSETYLWDPPGGDEKREIACLSVPAPSLDTSYQPHYNYYIGEGDKLDLAKYEEEMAHLAETIVKAAVENKDTAFGGKGINTLIIPRYGQGAFLGSVDFDDQKEAAKIFYKTLVTAITRHKNELGSMEIAMSVYGPSKNQEVDDNFVSKLTEKGIDAYRLNGEITRNARDGDLIVNAWDPHSAPGNGCDSDGSFDGAMGMATGIPITQIPWLNLHLNNLKNYVGVHRLEQERQE